MGKQRQLYKNSRKSVVFGLLTRCQALLLLWQSLLSMAHAQEFSWQLPYIDEFNPAVTATVQTEPPLSTCGYPGAANTFFNTSRGSRQDCTTRCHPSRTFPNKTNDYLTSYASNYLGLIGGGQFWQDNCDPELSISLSRKRRHSRLRKRQAVQYCFAFNENLPASFSRETHVVRIRHSHDIQEGVVLDAQKLLRSSDRLSLSLRVSGSDLKLTYDNRVRVYHNPAPPDTWTHIAIQNDVFGGDDGVSLLVNGNYLTPFEVYTVMEEEAGSPARRKRQAPQTGISESVSFGMIGDPGLPETFGLQFVTIQQCRDIDHNAMVRVDNPGHDLLAHQESIAGAIFSRGPETSIYNCPYDEATLERFACAFYLPALHSDYGHEYLPCKRLCEEIKMACGTTLDTVPMLGNLSCEAYPEERCVDTDYVPYVGFYDGEIADYRYYNDILTNREIRELATGALTPVPPVMPVDFSVCLCPPDYPAIYIHSPHLCVTNQANDDQADLTRGGAYASIRYWGDTLHAPEMATDFDPYTAWVSSEGTEPVALVLVFPDTYQVLGLTFSLASDFPEPSADDVRGVDIALLSGDGSWHTVYYLDQSCDDASSGFLFEGDKYHASEVVCVSPSEEFHIIGRQYSVDFLWGKTDYLNETYVDPGLLSLLNGRGVRIRFNASPRSAGEDVPQLDAVSHIVTDLQVHARVYSQRTLCGCYEDGTETGGQCTDEGQCPCRSDNGDPQHGGQKCEPYVLQVVPMYGPIAGATRIIILGGYFGEYGPSPEQRYDASDDIYIAFENSGLACASIKANQTIIECVTAPLSDSSELIDSPLQLTVHFSSGFQLQGDSLVFTYRPNPVISDIEPLNSFLRGGIIQTVVGMDFNSVFFPLMTLTVIVNGNINAPQPLPELCTVLNNTLMHCPSPTVDPRLFGPTGRRRRGIETAPSFDDIIVLTDEKEGQGRSGRVRRQTTAINSPGLYEFEIGFILDGVPTYRNVTEALGPEEGQLIVHNDPEFEEWDPETLIFRPYDNDEYIDVSGSRMNFGAQLSDYRVTISREECDVVELNTNKLTCRPPSGRPKHDRYSKDDAHRVLLVVGEISIHVGYLKYYLSLWDDPTFRTIIISVGVVVVVLALTILIVWCVMKRLYGDPIAHIRARLNKKNRYSAAAQENSYEERPRRLMDMLDADLKVKIAECLIEPHTRMKLGHEVGKGNFGKVYSGLLAMPGQTQPRDCAVKTLKEDSEDVKELREFLEEATIMKDFQHPNVLTLYGVVIMKNKPHVLLPFMAYGDLRGYVNNPRNNFSVGELLDYGLQVAKGMAYLSSNKFVHRDLAARNCMVDENKQVKIADFGLARDIYERDYYAVEDRRRPMPIKWMAPECLETFKFDSRSDVWSYGVTLWEVMMRGRKPYPGIDNLDMKRFLLRGGRLDKPSFCPDVIYALMKDCWDMDPHSRPMFPLIAKRISDTIDAARQLETPPSEEFRPTSGPHDYLEMITMNQPGYVPLATAVPSDDVPGSSNELQSKVPSERYTSEPHKENGPQPDAPQYLKPFTQLPEGDKVKDDAEGYSGVRRPSQDKERYSTLSTNVNLSPDADMPKEDAPTLPPSDQYLVPTGSVVEPDQSSPTDGYLPPSRVSVDVEGGQAQYSNL